MNAAKHAQATPGEISVRESFSDVAGCTVREIVNVFTSRRFGVYQMLLLNDRVVESSSVHVPPSLEHSLPRPISHVRTCTGASHVTDLPFDKCHLRPSSLQPVLPDLCTSQTTARYFFFSR